MANIKSVILQKKYAADMTKGGIAEHLITFSIPLIVGNAFQQLYNTIDTWVVGNFVSNEAYSAIGATGPVINSLIGLFLGLSSGAGVVIAQFYGAKKYDRVHSAVHTAISLTFILALIFTALGIFMTPHILKIMKTPDIVFPESKTYLTIYFAGVAGLMIYNMGSGILRATGDSKRPFYFLVITTLLNTILDLVFVINFGMGVEGVALATVIAQGVSAALIIYSLVHSDSCIRLSFRELNISLAEFKLILRIGVPAALQMAVTAFSNIFVQSYINFFGADPMSGWTTFIKLDHFMSLPMQSAAIAATTFVGQNLGKGQTERAKKGVRVAFIMAELSTLATVLPLILFAPAASRFFNKKPEVVQYSIKLLRYISPFNLLGCINQVYSGALRGAGNSKIPMAIMLGSFVAFRQIYLFITSRFICNEFLPIAMGYPAGWVVCSAVTLIYYKRAKLEKTRLTAEK